MRVHILQHVPFEGPGKIMDWCRDGGHDVTCTRFYESNDLPLIAEIDLLVIMGGPMSVNDEDLYPWLKNEKEFISRVITSNVPAIGICLGAQLIAAAAGCRVYAGGKKEIGWFPVFRPDGEAPLSAAALNLPDRFTPLHWHGETFDLPRGAELLASSGGYPHQAFLMSGNVIALQFHLEMDDRSLSLILENCRDEIVQGEYIQSEDEIKNPEPEWMGDNHRLLYRILDGISS